MENKYNTYRPSLCAAWSIWRPRGGKAKNHVRYLLLQHGNGICSFELEHIADPHVCIYHQLEPYSSCLRTNHAKQVGDVLTYMEPKTKNVTTKQTVLNACAHAYASKYALCKYHQCRQSALPCFSIWAIRVSSWGFSSPIRLLVPTTWPIEQWLTRTIFACIHRRYDAEARDKWVLRLFQDWLIAYTKTQTIGPSLLGAQDLPSHVGLVLYLKLRVLRYDQSVLRVFPKSSQLGEFIDDKA